MTEKKTNIEKLYQKTVLPAMMKKFGYENIMQAPRLMKCCVNMGVGRAAEDIKILEQASKDMALITGQRPVFRRAKKAISNFKIRQGQAIGCSVTLRKKSMFEFVDRLINVALPRVRDFRGVNPRGFDNTGNYSLGVREQNIFPEVVSDRVTQVQGMDITLVTSAETKEEALYLLRLLGMPFRGKSGMLQLDELK